MSGLMQNGEVLMEKTTDSAGQLLRQNLHNLQTRWDHIIARAKDKKVHTSSGNLFSKTRGGGAFLQGSQPLWNSGKPLR